MARLALLLLAVLAVAQAKPLIPLMESSGFTDFARMLKVAALDIDNEKVHAVGTLFVPTNEAVAKFASSMGMSVVDLLTHKGLVDSILSYHFVPGVTLTRGSGASQLTDKPLLLATAELGNYMAAVKHTNGATLTDMQGNTGNVLTEKSAQDGKLIAWGIDRVMMSDGYFTSAAAALKQFPDLSNFKKLVTLAQSAPGDSAVDDALNSDVTIFAPVDSAFSKAGVSAASLSPAAANEVALYHMLQGSRVVPTGFKNNEKLRTLLKGHTITSWVNDRPTLLNIYTGKQVTAHQVTLVPEVGKPVHIIAPNVYVRKATLQGINGVLTPYGLKTSSSSAGRRLLQGGSRGLDRGAARSWASLNAGDAIAAAASGRVPTNFATGVGQQQAAFAAAGCANCARWSTTNTVGF